MVEKKDAIPEAVEKNLSLLKAYVCYFLSIFYFFDQMIALQKL